MSALKNHKHELFARYLSEGKTPIQAAKDSDLYPGMEDYTIQNSADRLSRRTEIAHRVLELRDQSAARTTITIARVLNELAKIGFANMMDYIKVQEDGSAYVDLKDMDRDKAAAVSEIVVDEYMEGKGDEARAVKRVRLKLHDKRAALMDIGKHLGMFKQRVEVTGKDGAPIETRKSVEVSLLSRDEREMLKQLLLLAAERKRGQAVGVEPKMIETEYEESK